MISLGTALHVVLIANFFSPSTEYSIILNSAKNLPNYTFFKVAVITDRKLRQVAGIPSHKIPTAIFFARSDWDTDYDDANTYSNSQDFTNLDDLTISSNASLVGTEKQHSPREICDALHNFQGEELHSPATRALLLELTPKVMSCHDKFTAEEVGNALYGLRGMSGDCSNVLKLLSVLLPKIISSNCEMNSTYIGMSFEGLRGIRRYSEASALIDFLYRQVDTMLKSTNQLQDLSCENVLILGMQMALSTVELLEAFDDKYPKWESINLIIVDEIARRKSVGQLLFTDTDMQSSNVFKKSCKNQYITLSSNYNVFGPYGTEAMLNVDTEILPLPQTSSADSQDAPIGGNIRFCMSRDKLLSESTTGLEAVGAKFLRKLEYVDFERWLLNRTANAKI